MSARQHRHSPRIQRLQAFLVQVVLAVIRRLPFFATAVLASAAARILCIADKRHRRIMMNQMRLAFGDSLTEAERLRLSYQCYRHELLLFTELARLPRLGPEFVERNVEVPELARYRELKKSGRGVLIITAHIGCWELLAHVAVLKGFPITALARPLKNPFLDDVLNRLRTHNGNEIRQKHDSLRAIGQLVREGRWVCFLYDQNGGPKDPFVPFFGVPAATWRSAPFVHLKFDTPILVCTLMRTNWIGSRFQLNIHSMIDPEESRTAADPELHVLQQIHAGYEEAIRAHPEQWIWQHRRWKTRPTGEDIPVIDGVPLVTAPVQSPSA